MATYKGIKGVKVQSLASDPPAAQSIGQVWYNTASNVLKYSIQGDGAWSTGGVVNTTAYFPGNLGIQTAAMKFGGQAYPYTVNSETYNGTAWAEGANIGSARYGNAGFGTTTAGVTAAGRLSGNIDLVETYDGTSWTAATAVNSARYLVHGIGVQTAGIIVGGEPGTRQEVETYNGSAWTETGDLNTGRGSAGLAGTSLLTLASGGGPGNGLGVVESFDGTSWTETTNLNSDRANPNGGGAVYTAAIVFGGTTPPGQTKTGKTEKWNGSAWTEVADLATPRELLGAAQTGPSSVSLAFTGRDSGGNVTACEEWNDPVISTKTVTVS